MADDHDDTNQRSIPTNRLWLVFAGIVLVHTVVNALLSPLDAIHDPPEWVRWVLVGWLVVLPNLFAVWAALGPGAFAVRFPTVGTAFVIVVLASSLRNWNVFQSRWIENWLDVGGVSGQIVSFLVVTGSTYLIRRLTGWRIDGASAPTPRDKPLPQFSLRYLFAMTTAWALILTLFNGVTFGDPNPDFFEPEFDLWVSVYLSSVALPTVVFPLLLLSTRPKITKDIALVALAGFGIWLLFVLLLPNINGGDELAAALPFLVGAAISGLLTSLPLRFAGYRLVRCEANGK